MNEITLTSKRQATLPKALCDEMGVRSGDKLCVDATMVEGQRVWVLWPERPLAMPWFGKLKRYAKGKSHRMRDIRASIAKGSKHGRR